MFVLFKLYGVSVFFSVEPWWLFGSLFIILKAEINISSVSVVAGIFHVVLIFR